jgi:hypothetical protein
MMGRVKWDALWRYWIDLAYSVAPQNSLEMASLDMIVVVPNCSALTLP